MTNINLIFKLIIATWIQHYIYIQHTTEHKTLVHIFSQYQPHSKKKKHMFIDKYTFILHGWQENIFL